MPGPSWLYTFVGSSTTGIPGSASAGPDAVADAGDTGAADETGDADETVEPDGVAAIGDVVAEPVSGDDGCVAVADDDVGVTRGSAAAVHDTVPPATARVSAIAATLRWCGRL